MHQERGHPTAPINMEDNGPSTDHLRVVEVPSASWHYTVVCTMWLVAIIGIIILIALGYNSVSGWFS